MLRIAFICSANMCRSVMAQAICTPEVRRRDVDVEVLAGGTTDMGGCPPVRSVYETCNIYGTPPTKERATFVRDLPLATIDRFLVMEERHATALVDQHHVPADRVHLLGSFDPESGNGTEVEDPIGQDMTAFDLCYRRLRRCIGHYLDTEFRKAS